MTTAIKDLERKGFFSSNVTMVDALYIIDRIQSADYIDVNSSEDDKELVTDIDMALLAHFSYVTEMMYIVDADNMTYFRAVKMNDDIVINKGTCRLEDEYRLRKYVDPDTAKHQNLYIVVNNNDGQGNVFAVNDTTEDGKYPGIDIFLEDMCDAIVTELLN